MHPGLIAIMAVLHGILAGAAVLVALWRGRPPEIVRPPVVTLPLLSRESGLELERFALLRDQMDAARDEVLADPRYQVTARSQFLATSGPSRSG